MYSTVLYCNQTYCVLIRRFFYSSHGIYSTYSTVLYDTHFSFGTHTHSSRTDRLIHRHTRNRKVKVRMLQIHPTVQSKLLFPVLFHYVWCYFLSNVHISHFVVVRTGVLAQTNYISFVDWCYSSSSKKEPFILRKENSIAFPLVPRMFASLWNMTKLAA